MPGERNRPSQPLDGDDDTLPCGCTRESWPEELPLLLRSMAEQRGIGNRELLDRSGLNPTHLAMVCGRQRRPLRDWLIRLSLALGCKPEEAQALITLPGHDPLRPYIKRDAVILFCLAKGIAVPECQQYLIKFDLNPLKE